MLHGMTIVRRRILPFLAFVFFGIFGLFGCQGAQQAEREESQPQPNDQQAGDQQTADRSGEGEQTVPLEKAPQKAENVPGTPVEVTTRSFRPAKREVTDDRIAQLQVPDGFEISVFARDLQHARMMAVDDDGTVYLTRPKQGDVLMLRDTDGDGAADERQPVASDLQGVHGIVLHDGSVYLITNTEVHRASINDDGTFGERERLVDDLPDGAQHPNRTAAVGPDEKLYISVGSSCNACEETNQEHATILRSDLDLQSRDVFAKGLRNTIGFGWHPDTQEMWGMDHGSDLRGDNVPPEELNRLEQGKDYGWPYIYGERKPDYTSGSPENMDIETYAQTTAPAVLTYQAHAAPIGMVFYDADAFPDEYRGDAFIAMRGSWNRYPAVGYKIVRLRFEDGEPQGFEDFVTGFLVEDGEAHFGRLAGVAVAEDGSLLFSDDTNGVIYRVRQSEETQTTKAE